MALGRTAEIYAWEQGQILKLFWEWFSADGVEHEARIAHAVHAAGLPVPAVGEVVEVNGRLGLIYERVEGPSIFEAILARPWTLLRSARLLAQVQADVHARGIVPELPSQRERLENKIRAAEALPPDLQKAALKALGKMPDGSRLCHGDFHPGNVLMAARGPIIIDWIDATYGNPLADIVRSSLLIRGAAAGGSLAGWRMKTMVRWYHATYLRRCFQLRPGDQQQFAAWQPIVAAARLSENILEEQDWLLSLVRAGLAKGD